MKKIKQIQYYELENGLKFALVNKDGILKLVSEAKKIIMERKYDKINEIMEYLYEVEKMNIEIVS